MKNKLLLSTALVSGLVAGGSALAQTTVTGDLTITYKAMELGTTGALSRQGMGRESQLNIQNKGSLNNGMTYAAGFSLEFDGQSTVSTTGYSSNNSVTLPEVRNAEQASISNENLYIDLIAGSTTLTFGVDHVQNSTTATVPMITDIYDNVALGLGGVSTNQLGAKTKESAYVGIVQGIPGTGITASAIYAPQGGNFGGNDQEVGTTSARNPSYELGLAGADIFGVKGLNARYFTNKEAKAESTLTDLKGTSYGVSYTYGQFAAGFDRMKTNRTAGTTQSEVDVTMNRYGVTYAATKDISLGYVYSKADVSSATADEKIKSIQVGYSLGPVAIIADYSTIDNIQGRASESSFLSPQDGKQAQIRLTTKF